MQAKFIQPGREIDHTPSGDVAAGAVVIQNNLIGIAKTAIADGVQGSIAVDGIFDVVQAAEVLAAGTSVYWDTDGNPVGGEVDSGALTATAPSNTFAGHVLVTSAATDGTVRIRLNSSEKSEAGVTTATSITATGATFPIAGQKAAQGGSIAVAGGQSETDANAGGAASVTGGQAGATTGTGGAVSLTGGTPGVTGIGGAATVAGGPGGTTSGTGGAAALNGGAAASASSNAIGGAASVTGGIGKGNLAGGAVSATGGVGGATGAGGAIAVAGGAGGSTSGTGGAITITGGAGSDNDAVGGAVAINGGAGDGTGADGVITIGTANAASVTIGKAGVLTAFSGPVQKRGTEARTATVAGDGTGEITAGTNFVIVTSDDADKQISLPIASVGDEIEIYIASTHGCELISSVTAHKVNNVTVGETNELALVLDSLYRCKYVDTNEWIVTGVDKEGVVETPLTPNAIA